MHLSQNSFPCPQSYSSVHIQTRCQVFLSLLSQNTPNPCCHKIYLAKSSRGRTPAMITQPRSLPLPPPLACLSFALQPTTVVSYRSSREHGKVCCSSVESAVLVPQCAVPRDSVTGPCADGALVNRQVRSFAFL